MMTKAEVNKMRKDLEKVLSAYGVKAEIKFEIGTIRYDALTFTAKLKGTFQASGENTERELFERDRVRFGSIIPSDWYGSHIKIQGKIFQVVGVRPRSKKYPILLKNLSTGEVNTQCSIQTVLGANYK